MIGCVAFAQNDPWNFGNIHRAMIALFRVSILDNWIEVTGDAPRPDPRHNRAEVMPPDPD
jgi:hypothetical protein